MQEMDLTTELETVKPELVDVLCQESDVVLWQITGHLNQDEQARVNRVVEKRSRLSLILDIIAQKDRRAWSCVIQTLCMACQFLPMQLETRLMSAAGEGSSFDDTTDPLQEFSRRRPAGDSLFDDSTTIKRPRTDLSEIYKSSLMSMLLQRHEEMNTGILKPTSLDHIPINLMSKNMWKERMDKTRRNLRGLQSCKSEMARCVKVLELLEPSNTSESRVIVLLGKAGTGKTMLMQHITYQWAKGALPDLSLIYLFEFRQLNLIKKKLTLRQLLFNFFHKPEEDEDLVFEFISTNPQKLCIIFDGYDEFAGKIDLLGTHTYSMEKPVSVIELFSALYTGKLLNGCTLLVTCRPKDVLDLPLHAVDQVGEVLGFDHRQVEEFARNFFNDCSYKEQALRHLMEDPNILNMCYVPALCFVCCMCLDHSLSQGCGKSQLPNTMTQVYIKMLLAFLSKKQAISGPKCSKTLLQKYRQEINELSELAMRGLDQSNIVFYAHDVSNSVIKFFSENAFLSVFEVKNEDRVKNVGCAFIHLTMQEFFAALHLITSDSINETELRKSFNLKSKWISKNDRKTVFTDMFHIFVSGLSSKECTSLLSTLARHNESWVEKRQRVILHMLTKLGTSNLSGPKIIELCHCAHETQDPQLAELIGAHQKYEFRNFRLTPVDMNALVYILKHSRRDVCLDIAGCSIEVEGLDVLPRCSAIQGLVFRSRKYNNTFAEALAAVLPKIEFLQIFEFVGGNINDTGVANLARALQDCPHLKEINFNDNSLTDQGIAEVTNVFHKVTSLRKVNLNNNIASLDGVFTLINSMCLCNSIEEIKIDGNRRAEVYFSNRAGHLMKSAVNTSSASCNRRNRKIRISSWRMTPRDMENLCKILGRCPGLSEVDLSSNELNDEECKTLVEMLPELQISKQIILNNNQVSSTGSCYLSHALASCSNVTEVWLQSENIVIRFLEQPVVEPDVCISDSTDPVNKHVQEPTLFFTKKLRLINCQIQVTQLSELFETVKQCFHLEELDLSQNALGDRGLKIVAQVLPELQDVVHINLSGNSVTIAGILYLTDSFKKCKHIHEVNISSGGEKNLMMTFNTSKRRNVDTGKRQENGLGCTKVFRLKETDIKQDDMDKLCKRLVCFDGLSELDFSDSTLSDESVGRLLNCLSRLSSLNLLNISNCGISPEGALLLLKSIICWNRVTAIALRPRGKAFIKFVKMKAAHTTCKFNEYTLDKKMIEKLSRILKQCLRLTYLDLSSNFLKDEGVACFLQFVPGLRVMNEISLNDNQLSQAGVLHLVETMTTCSRMSEADVCLGSNERCLIRFIWEEEKAETLRLESERTAEPQGKSRSPSRRRASHTSCHASQSVRLKECSFTLRNLELLASKLQKCLNLTQLELSFNTIPSGGLQALVETLAGLKSLKKLILRDNGITAVEIRSLIKELGIAHEVLNVRIEEPWVHGEDAVMLVSECISTNVAITEIRVEKNTIYISLGNHSLSSGNSHFMPISDKEELPGEFTIKYPVESISFIRCGLVDQHIHLLKSLVEQCCELQGLDLSNNTIESRGARILIELLPSLEKLRRLSLESMRAGATELVQLARSLSKLQNIESLSFSHNKMEDEATAALANILPLMPKLKQINFSCCSSLTPVGGLNLIQGLSSCTSLEDVNLDSIPLNSQGIGHLAKGLSAMSLARRLILNNISTSVEDSVQLLDSLKSCTILEEISLSNNRIGDIGVLKLVEHIPNWQKLKKINLSQNSIGKTGGECLAKTLTNCKFIEEISLGNNNFGDEATATWADVLSKMSQLRVLSLQSNKISSEGCIRLAEVLPLCPHLEEVSLSENELGSQGALKLSQALSLMKSLKRLDLKLINIENKDSVHLAAGLGHCLTIEEVNLSWNGIGDEVAEKLAEVLPRMKNLKKLDLECNKITEMGTTKLAEVLKNCSTIKVIRLWKNQMSNEMAKALQNKDPRLNFSSVIV
ncbi:NLR family, CARD domain containing 5 isoform X1 [Polypterus senegalus]|uniref:NLR family, CARD domain containing 5 isoform X1 n=1 Tax=Polypterus senegalus TaxID=55291 RepID=UPI0019650B36|nr:NLR family, CARD domain containing 5 isoform X1 [Polypterus senegalus]XP_039618910.1 NLR family, CARD domain containing 5 isoform X1 [Polypterus senegalus]XP_039618911.1 NLR family, CARD domain containing 5 isoform X1 [Polypterus senegalus]XP_039618912.1 NLR family, CARD domain containing 5 isoform X1 [Polypterus senegalus]